jgi:hypothetical protein
MEVASPLTIAHAAAGTKRPLAFSPGLMDSSNLSPFPVSMEMTDDSNTMQRVFKRRRFHNDAMETADGPTDYHPFMNVSIARSKSLFSGNGKNRIKMDLVRVLEFCGALAPRLRLCCKTDRLYKYL